MYRTTLRTASRQALGSLRAQTPRSALRFRRPASTASPADRPRSWKSSALRWGLAIAAVYYYNTSPVFAEEAADQEASSKSAPSSFAESDLPTVDAVVEQKRQQLKPKTAEKPPASNKAEQAESTTPEAQSGSIQSQPAGAASESASAATTAATTAATSPEALEEEAGQEAAFNPETGEINWDCPCLGGMAHGPCGEEFKTAFSCFVYSSEEPKGMDCIDKFQGMQECFRKYPDIYGSELTDDEESQEPAPDSDQMSGPSPPSEEEHSSPENHQASRTEDVAGPPEATEKPEEGRPVIDGGLPNASQDAGHADERDPQKQQPGKKEKESKE
ncbi:hypothetical protein E4U54_002007 [Claviceps lovelessii]|nr:hypothetical protein E4U54_002007 [Claviceps lovelessii]